MRTEILKIMALIVALISASANATITDVNIIPVVPSPLDAISIVTYGVEGSGPVFITDSVFDSDGSSLNLDIWLDVGFAAVVTPWSHTEDIGTLPAGFYDLTVRTWEENVETYAYPTSFEVVPEPATLALFGGGSLLLFLKRKCRQSGQ